MKTLEREMKLKELSRTEEDLSLNYQTEKAKRMKEAEKNICTNMLYLDVWCLFFRNPS